MSNFKIIYEYYQGWCYDDKEGYGKYSYDEALEKFNNFETFFIVAQKENEDKPFVYIMITNKDSFYVSFLNEKLDDEREYKYQILHNLEKNKLFLIEFMIRKFDYSNENLEDYLLEANQYNFAKNDENSNWEWYILDKVFCSETNYINNEDVEYFSENIIDENSLWENIPKFGNWDYFLRDDHERVKFIEVRD